MTHNEKITRILGEMGRIFVSFGFCEVEVGGVKNYVSGGVWYRLTPMLGGRTILLEAAGGGGAYEDVFWYDFSPGVLRSLGVAAESAGDFVDEPAVDLGDSSYYAETVGDYLAFFKTDVIRYYAEDSFERFILSEGFGKVIHGGVIRYVKDGAEVGVWYDFTAAGVVIEVKLRGCVYRKVFGLIEAETVFELKSFVENNFAYT